LLTQTELNKRIKQETPAFIWGQTCDGCDWLTKNKKYPRIEKGEWLIYRNMGAYNKSLECEFNGFERPQIFIMD